MKKEFLIERDGKQFATYKGLLDEAHSHGLKAVTTTLLQIPSDENKNLAICQAVIVTEKGTFSGLGDASPANAGRIAANALIRMAETRAKARAFRDAVNVGVVSIEELGEDDHEPAPRKVQVTRETVEQAAQEIKPAESRRLDALTVFKEYAHSQAKSANPADLEDAWQKAQNWFTTHYGDLDKADAATIHKAYETLKKLKEQTARRAS